VGIEYNQLQEVAKSGGAILIAGVKNTRMKPVLAALRGNLVSVFVTNLDFAHHILELYANGYEKI
jgi:DNA-binding transcriptional regulator LsrR (DeoR family)